MAEVVEVKTIGEVERIVLGSGLYMGTSPVQFSNTGTLLSWAEVWLPSEEFPHPVFARVDVHRKDVPIPTRVTIRWDEQFPAAAEEWAEKWLRSPMRHFGRTVRMVAYRQAFRDLLGDLVIEEELPELAQAAAPAPRHWGTEIVGAETVANLDEIVKAARAERVFTPDAGGTALDRLWRERRRELVAAAEEATAPRPKPNAPAKPTPPKMGKPVAPTAPAAKKPSRPRRTKNPVADNLEADVAQALQALTGKK